MNAKLPGCFLYIQAALGEHANGANQIFFLARGVRLADPVGNEPKRRQVGAMNHELP